MGEGAAEIVEDLQDADVAGDHHGRPRNAGCIAALGKGLIGRRGDGGWCKGDLARSSGTLSTVPQWGQANSMGVEITSSSDAGEADQGDSTGKWISVT